MVKAKSLSSALVVSDRIKRLSRKCANHHEVDTWSCGCGQFILLGGKEFLENEQIEKINIYTITCTCTQYHIPCTTHMFNI